MTDKDRAVLREQATAYISKTEGDARKTIYGILGPIEGMDIKENDMEKVTTHQNIAQNRTNIEADIKRFNITFQKSKFERFQELIRSAGCGREAPGLVLNVFVGKAVELLEREVAESKKEGRKIGLHEMMNVLSLK
ncbi:hypothetical protein HGA64_03700 [Candidatus Falkowbacteria bacterium]|nr:hypothetical protein [Candidatus Falkowbacteria bacterium]